MTTTTSAIDSHATGNYKKEVELQSQDLAVFEVFQMRVIKV